MSPTAGTASPRAAEAGLNDRQQRILELVRATGYASIESLAEAFAVSAQTVRRDMTRLDDLGLLQRFHGGAGLPEDSVRLSYRQKLGIAVAAKTRIGAAAAALVPDGASIYLDVGTTAEAVAEALLPRRLTAVYTNSMGAAAILARAQGMETYVTGGQVRGADGSLVGAGATAMLAGIAVDVAVIGCSGFATDGGATDFDPQKVAVKQAALKHARLALLVADAGKFARHAVVRIAPPGRFARLVTDSAPPDALAQALAAAGTEIVLG